VTTEQPKILIVDDEPDAASLLAELLRKRGYDVVSMCSARECLDWLQQGTADIVITDVHMTGMSGIELCVELHDRHPDLGALVMTGESTLDVAIAAMRAGAYDYIVKPVSIDVLEVAVARAVLHLDLRREVKRLHTTAAARAIEGIVGESVAIRSTLDLVRRVAASDATVLITGESGTGKELIAAALHRSQRCEEPFVAINCAAVPAPLLESELFGHVRGAFTDASASRPGLFVQAGRGTLFLDEIGEMPLEMQVKLVRVLQERKVRPVGSDEEAPFEARIVASTHRDLATEVKTKRFRKDLYYRINVVTIAMPPLRDRGHDVLVLAQYFLRRIALRTGKAVRAINAPASRLLLDYDWRGNVRELENCIERAVALCRADEITPDDLPGRLREYQVSRFVVADSPADLVTLDEMERRYVRQVLSSVGGNKSSAARVLGIDRRSVYRRLTPDATTVADDAMSS
jgi:two-component system, NtrC family, response regulator HydG